MIDHAASFGRFALVEAANGLDIGAIRQVPARHESAHAALYYPWVQLANPLDPSGAQVAVPPSGFVCGAMLRNDRDRGISKAPANLPLQGVTGLERNVTKGEQEILNPLGINCIRNFAGRGIRIWGARTLSGDPEWKYISLRRYCTYLERSIEQGTQWAVFEPNGESLWANVRQAAENFLLREWQNGALVGDRPEKAYFVKCDRSTMTQDDIDNGRLVMLIGVAPVRPSEFVIFRIGHWTAG